jgi:hypothetical protein
VRSIIVVGQMEDLWYASVLVSLDIRSRFRMELVLLKKLVQKPKRNGMSCFRFLFLLYWLYLCLDGVISPLDSVPSTRCLLCIDAAPKLWIQTNSKRNFRFSTYLSPTVPTRGRTSDHFIVTGSVRKFLPLKNPCKT